MAVLSGYSCSTTFSLPSLLQINTSPTTVRFVFEFLRLWSFYVDLVESLGSLESTPTRYVYEKLLDLRIATPQIILHYAFLLEEHKYFEDAFKVYERGVKVFKYPHVKNIWVTYLSKFVKRYGKTKPERARELFEHAVEKHAITKRALKGNKVPSYICTKHHKKVKDAIDAG